MEQRTDPWFGKDIIARMFFSAALAMVITKMAGVAANIIDGIITSRHLGSSAYSAVSLLGPFTGTLMLLSGFFSTGSQVVCSQLIGNGKKDEANHVFSMSAAFTVFLSVAMLGGVLLFPKQLCYICGVNIDKNLDLYPVMLDYLHGYMYGIPAVMIIQVLAPMVVMDGRKKLFSLSAAALCGVDVAGDLLNVYVFHGGLFGMGMATSVAFILQLLIILSHFLKKDKYFRFSPNGILHGHLKAVAFAGAPAFVRELATILRDLFINRMNLAVAMSIAAVAARGVQNDLNKLLFCVGAGVGKALLSMTGVYYGAQDRNGLRRLFSAAARIGLFFSGVAGVICFACAGSIARFYMDDPEAVTLAAFAIRCMALSLPLDMLLVSYQSYLQGIGNRVLTNILSFAERLFVPLLTAFLLSRYFGSRGIMASIAVCKVLLSLTVLIIVSVHSRRFPPRREDFMYLPAEFGIPESDSRDVRLSTMDDVMQESKLAEQFCLDHGADHKKAKLMALFIEEMAGNIILHGKPRRFFSVCADCRLYVQNNRMCLSLRDYCRAFDPTFYYRIHQEDKDGEGIGIRMVLSLAKEVKYFYTFNSNNLVLYLD